MRIKVLFRQGAGKAALSLVVGGCRVQALNRLRAVAEAEQAGGFGEESARAGVLQVIRPGESFPLRDTESRTPRSLRHSIPCGAFPAEPSLPALPLARRTAADDHVLLLYLRPVLQVVEDLETT
jgi:hypothetical protein